MRASPGPTTRAPTDTMLDALCSRDNLAVYGSEHTTARAPGTLLAAIEMPTPVPQASRPPARIRLLMVRIASVAPLIDLLSALGDGAFLLSCESAFFDRPQLFGKGWANFSGLAKPSCSTSF